MTMQPDPPTLDEPLVTRRATHAFPARFDVIPETTRFVETFCATHGIGRNDALRLAVIVEELVANTIVHGHRGETDAPIAIALFVVAEGVALSYEDTAPAFDIAAALLDAKRPLDAAFDERPVGDLGLRLLAHYAESVRYAYDNGRNRVLLTLPRSP